MSLDQYPPNPHYGSGIYRRRVRLIGGDGSVTAILNDDFHAMWSRIIHDGETIVAVEAELLRWPKSTCPGAALALRELVGLTLSLPRRDFYGAGRTERNCTHLLDLALLAMGHAGRAEEDHVIDIAIPDFVAGRTRIEATVDGRLVHDWTIKEGVIHSACPMHGARLSAGFATIAESRLAGLELDVARMIQKGHFVARGRRFIVDQLPVRMALDEIDRVGSCYSYSYPQLEHAQDELGYARDHSLCVSETLPPSLVPETMRTLTWHDR